MLLTISTTRFDDQHPARDFGYLLHKNPERAQSFDLSFGQAHVFYPQADDERCECAMLLDIDTVRLVRKRDGQAMDQYVNDRPYVASSFLSVAISRVFRDAMAGKSREREELAEAKWPFKVHLPVVPSRGGEELLRRLFEPFEYSITAKHLPLDERFPQWGESSYFSLDLSGTVKLRDLLSHLYVLLPVLDDDKHYWVGDDEVQKLLERGEGWLQAHPSRDLIVDRYLRRRRVLTRAAFEQLTRDEIVVEEEQTETEQAELNEQVEAVTETPEAKPISLHEQRLEAVTIELKASGAHRVLDLGCGEGKLLRHLMKDKQFAEIVGMDVSHRALEMARDKLRFDRMPPMQQKRLHLMQGSLTYRDARLEGFDAAAVVEVVEHLEPSRLAAFERVLWEFARPQSIVLTTPNRDYNAHWETLPFGQMRHKDHRFEWSRDEFAQWAQGVAQRFGYSVRLENIGEEDGDLGSPSQMAVFTREENDAITRRKAANAASGD
ncbi:MAG TPA: 3' terminal RNA ribose 2'-O-methyltransferase Hen1 [Abditibacteriaceae bacterium]|nr:3' terminal RNA ribose 2'-O-methyltransferase Hen1 [Abditibacteriaceae bacterium]